MENTTNESNKASLKARLIQMQMLIIYVFNTIPSNTENEKNFSLLKETFKNVLNELIKKSDQSYSIDHYVKIGVLLLILIENNQYKIDLNKANKPIMAYFEIFKIIQNKRIEEITLLLKNLIEKISKDKKMYPEMFVKEKDSTFVSLREYMLDD